jgi:hypothetical protein
MNERLNCKVYVLGQWLPAKVAKGGQYALRSPLTVRPGDIDVRVRHHGQTYGYVMSPNRLYAEARGGEFRSLVIA